MPIKRFEKIISEVSKMSIFEKRMINDLSTNEILILSQFEKTKEMGVNDLLKLSVNNYCSRAQFYRYLVHLINLNYLERSKETKNKLLNE